eukprot:1368830-Rhodomonas_salina.2
MITHPANCKTPSLRLRDHSLLLIHRSLSRICPHCPRQAITPRASDFTAHLPRRPGPPGFQVEISNLSLLGRTADVAFKLVRPLCSGRPECGVIPPASRALHISASDHGIRAFSCPTESAFKAARDQVTLPVMTRSIIIKVNVRANLT